MSRKYSFVFITRYFVFISLFLFSLNINEALAACACSVQWCVNPAPDCSEPTPAYYVNADGPKGSCTDNDVCEQDPINGNGETISCGNCVFGYHQTPSNYNGGCAGTCNPGNNCETSEPEAVNLIAPANGAVFPANTANVSLSWNPLNSDQWGETCEEDPENEYRTHFGTTNPPPFYVQGGTPKSVPVSPGQTYFWNVHTTNGVDGGEGVSETRSFSVSSNNNPTGSINTPSNNANFLPGSNITVTATGIDNDPSGLYRVDILGRLYDDPNNPGPWFTWASNGTQQLCSGSNTCNYSKVRNAVSTGTYQIILRVVDNYDTDYVSSGVCAWDYPANQPYWTDCGPTDMIVIDVRDTTFPSASITAPTNNSTWVVGQTVQIAGSANDSGGLASYAFMRKAPGSGTWFNMAPNNSNSCNPGNISCTFNDDFTFNTVGQWSIAVYATDTSGNTCAGNWIDTVSPSDVNCGPNDIYTINIIDPQPPTGMIDAPSEGYIYNTRTNTGQGLNVMDFGGSITDTTDAPPLTVQTYRISDANWYDPAATTYVVGTLTCASNTSCSTTANWANPVPGLWYAYIRGTDNAGMTCSGRSVEGYLACDRLPTYFEDNSIFTVNVSPNGQFTNEPLDGSYTHTIGSALNLASEAADAAASGVKNVRIATKRLSPSVSPTYYSADFSCNDQASCTPSFSWPVAGQPAVVNGEQWETWIEVEDSSGATCVGNPDIYATETQISFVAKCDINSAPNDVQDYTLIDVQDSQDLPWFTAIKGNVFIYSGIESIIGPQTPVAGWTPPYLSYGKESADFDAALFSDSNINFTNGQSNPNDSGVYAKYIGSGGNIWPDRIPTLNPTGALDLKAIAGNNGSQCNQIFRRTSTDPLAISYVNAYQISDLTCLQQAINAINTSTPYRFIGSSGEGILVVYVNGTGTLNFPNQFVPETNNGRRILFVLGNNVKVHFDDTFGNATPAQTTSAIVQAGFISRDDIFFDTNGTDTDTTAVVEGPVATLGSLKLNRDRGTNNEYPAEMFVYNYKYLYRLTFQSRASANENYTGLMIYDVQYDN